MPARKMPRPRKEDIDAAVEELKAVIDIDSLGDVDKFFALDLMMDYGKWAAIANAAWDDIAATGILNRQSSGSKDNRHFKFSKSESIGVFKDARASKSDLAMKISKFVKQGTVETEEVDELAAFNAF